MIVIIAALAGPKYPRSLRLAVQDAALSRRKHEFDSRRERQSAPHTPPGVLFPRSLLHALEPPGARHLYLGDLGRHAVALASEHIRLPPGAFDAYERGFGLRDERGFFAAVPAQEQGAVFQRDF